MQDLNDKVTGGQLSAAEWNEVPSELQNIIVAFGQSLTSADLNQLGKGVSGYAAVGDFYSTSGTANAIVLSTIGTIQAPPAYLSGMQVRFKAANSNLAGPVTINVATLGIKPVRDQFDAPLIANDFIASNRYTLTYDPLFNAGLGAMVLQKASGAVINNGVSRNYIDGFILSNNTAATPASDLDISAGQCKDSGNTVNFDLTGTLGKRITAAWAEGGTPAVPVGGMPVGVALTNNTWYRVFAIQKPTLQIDIGFDTNSGASVLLNGANAGSLGYNKYRQIGWIRYGAGVIVKFTQTGDNFEWVDYVSDFANGAQLSFASTPRLVTAPPSTRASLNARAAAGGGGQLMYLWLGSQQATAPAVQTSSNSQLASNGTVSSWVGQTNLSVQTDSNSLIKWKFTTNVSNDLSLLTMGWSDSRGKQ